MKAKPLRIKRPYLAPLLSTISLIVLISSLVFIRQLVITPNEDDGDGSDPIDPDFDCGGRYDSTNIYGMGHPFENETDIHFMGGYVEGVHQGIDFFYDNLTNIVAAAPGYVEYINSTYWSPPLSPGNAYSVSVRVRFNATVMLNYGIEMWTTEEYFNTLQLSLLSVEVGDWINQSALMGQFVSCNTSAHIDWSVHLSGTRVPPCPYYNATEYAYLNGIFQTYCPGHDLCE